MSFDRLRPQNPNGLGLLCACAAPFICAVASLGPERDLEASAFIAQTLDRPLTPAMWLARACTFFPFGSLGLRVAFASALGLAVLAAALYRAISALLRAQGVAHAGIRAAIATSACWIATALTPVFDQGITAGGRALSGAFVVLVIHELQVPLLQARALDAVGGKHRVPTRLLGLWSGLLLAQDMFSWALLSPAAISCWKRAASSGLVLPRRPIALGMAAGAAIGAAASLSPHAALRTIDLWSGSGFWFGPSQGDLHAPSMIFTTAVQGLWTLVESHAWLAIASTLGAIAIAQTRPLRAAGRVWTLSLASLLVLGPTLAALVVALTGTPELEIAGASGPAALLGCCLPICVVLAAALSGALLAPDASPRIAANRRHVVATVFAGALGLFLLSRAISQSPAPTIDLADAWTAATIERMPARTLFLPADARIVNLARVAEAERHARPDLRVIPVASFGRATSARTIAQTASLRPLLRSYLLQGELSRAELESLRAERPVYLDLTAPSALHPAVVPASLSFEVAGAQVGHSEQRAAADAYEIELAALARGVESEAGRKFLASLDRAAARYFETHRDERHASAANERSRGRTLD
jgi:hypothetical protein